MDSFIVDKKTGLGLLLAIGSRYFVEMALLKLDKLQILPESNFSYVTFGYRHGKSVCLSSVTCLHPTQGFNFSGIFLHHIVAWSSGNSLTKKGKNHEDRPRGSPPKGALNARGRKKLQFSTNISL